MAQLGVYEEAANTVVLRTHACNETVAGKGNDGDTLFKKQVSLAITISGDVFAPPSPS